MSELERHGATKAVDAIVDSLLAGESDQLKATVRLPSAEKLEIQMVPLSLVDELDATRSRAAGWFGAASLASSVPAGIIVNWLTTDHAHPSTAAVAVLAVFATFAAVAWTLAAVATTRARHQRQLLKAFRDEG
jgi:hypothetical protein